MLKNEKGEASYISVFIYILVAVILIAFYYQCFPDYQRQTADGSCCGSAGKTDSAGRQRQR